MTCDKSYNAILRLAWVLGYCARPFSSKIEKIYAGRNGLEQRIALETKLWSRPIWFHVASSGELEQSLPIIDELKRRRPQLKILITFFSGTAQKAIELETKRRAKAGLSLSWDYADFAPFDFKKTVTQFVEMVRPEALVIINREIWRHLVATCDEKNIPCFLFSTHFPESAMSAKRWYAPSLTRFKVIGTTDEGSKERLSRLLAEGSKERLSRLLAEGANEYQSQLFDKESLPRIETFGDSRIERVLMRKRFHPKAPWEDFFTQKLTWICASVWPKDFEALKPSLEYVLDAQPDWRLVIVPHEMSPNFLNAISQWFKTRKNAARLWSRWSREPDDHSHLIVDAVGFLAELYRTAQLTYVGGSFQKKIHNVLEPAAYGKAILCGPFIQNSKEAVEMLGTGLFSASNENELLAQVKRLTTDRFAREEAGKAAESYLIRRLGSVGRYVDTLETFLKSAATR